MYICNTFFSAMSYSRLEMLESRTKIACKSKLVLVVYDDACEVVTTCNLKLEAFWQSLNYHHIVKMSACEQHNKTFINLTFSYIIGEQYLSQTKQNPSSHGDSGGAAIITSDSYISSDADAT